MKRFAAVLILSAIPVFNPTTPAAASFHNMQIEQVIAGVNGDTTAQAIQLRQRSAGQNLVQQAKLVVRDAAGLNPIVIVDFTTSVPNGAAGARILIASSAFANYTGPTVLPNFTMTNLVPPSYLSAGTLTFEADLGTYPNNVYWRLSWGGAGYTGTHMGINTIGGGNDADGNFGPGFPGPLPKGNTQALRFTGLAGDLSTTNQAQYAVTSGSATFVNNAGASFLVVPPCVTCRGDVDGDNRVDGPDIQAFVACLLNGSATSNACACADVDVNGALSTNDVSLLVNKLLGATDPNPACP